MKTKVALIIFTIFFIQLIIVIFNFKKDKSIKNMEFVGIIESVKLDVKGFALIRIGYKEYDLTYNNWALLGGEIQPGDSIVKKKGSLSIKVYRIATKDYKIYNQEK